MGRQLAFDREQLLDQVMHIFWKRGYQATSINHLVEETRVQPGSLYHSFNNKRGLLLATLDHYGTQSLERAKASLAGAQTFRDAVAEFLRLTLECSQGDPEGRSCFLVCTWMELSSHDPQVRACIEGNLRRVEGVFCTAAAQAQLQGELSKDHSPEALAKFVMTAVWGLRMMNSMEPDPSMLASVREQLLRSLEPVRQ